MGIEYKGLFDHCRVKKLNPKQVLDVFWPFVLAAIQAQRSISQSGLTPAVRCKVHQLPLRGEAAVGQI